MKKIISTNEKDSTAALSQVRSPAPSRFFEGELEGKFHGAGVWRYHDFVLLQFAVGQVYQSVEVLHHLFVMRRKKEGRLQFPIEILHRLQDRVGVFGVKVGGGFIGDQDVGTLHHRAGNGHPLALTPGEFGGFLGSHALQADPFQGFHHGFFTLSGGFILQKQRKFHVFVYRVHGQ